VYLPQGQTLFKAATITPGTKVGAVRGGTGAGASRVLPPGVVSTDWRGVCAAGSLPWANRSTGKVECITRAEYDKRKGLNKKKILAGQGPKIEVGDFQFGLNGGKIRDFRTRLTPFLQQYTQNRIQYIKSLGKQLTVTTALGNRRSGIAGRVKHPVTDKTWILYINLIEAPESVTVPVLNAYVAAGILKQSRIPEILKIAKRHREKAGRAAIIIEFTKKPKGSLLGRALSALVWISAKLISGVVKVIEAIRDAACWGAQAQLSQLAASAYASGGNEQQVAIANGIVNKICNKDAFEGSGFDDSGLGIWVLLGVAGVAAYFVV